MWKDVVDMSVEHLVNDAANFSLEEVFTRELKIRVIGCGGAGNNSIDRLQRIGVQGAETIAINTDKRHLDRIKADKRLLIGRSITRGLSAGGLPEIGEQCALRAEDEIRRLVAGADLTFITVGMGGGTGTGATPIIADLAKNQGSIVIAIATMPFMAERGRQQRAEYGLEKLKKCADSVIVLDNNRLLQMVPDLPIEQAFSVMDQLISEVIKGVTETITRPSLINIDFADLKTIVSGGGTSTMLYGENSSREPEKVIAETLDNPLLDVDYTGATGALVHITSGPSLKLRTINQVVEGITAPLDINANVIFGTRTDPEYEGIMKVMTIMTGITSSNYLNSPVKTLEICDIAQEYKRMDIGVSIVR